ncbi:MAG: shikimate kinase [Bacteroidetes bacterium]|nr:shikimate kinase [Bacteroidota bacterium]
MPLPDRIYLTGFMAAGKSTIGRILANTIGYDFVDLDHRIVDQTGESVVSLFKTRGEQAFRQLETDTLHSLSDSKRLVVSLGGGTVCFNNNLEWILENGFLVYLKVRPRQLLYRIRAKRDRPIFLDEQGNLLPDHEIKRKIDRMLADRCPFYEKAHLTLETDQQPVGQVVDWLKEAIEQWSPGMPPVTLTPFSRRKFIRFRRS